MRRWFSLICAAGLFLAGCGPEEKPVERPASRPSRTEKIYTGIETLKRYQALADSGIETFRRDPVEVAIAEMRNYFFFPSGGKLIPRFANQPAAINEKSISDRGLWGLKKAGKEDERIASWRQRNIQFDVYLRQLPVEAPGRGIWYAYQYFYTY